VKYAIICDPATPQALASTTLFDLLGDPSTWKENHTVIFIGDPFGTDKSWAASVVEAGEFPTQDDFFGLDDTWVILGPTEEDLVAVGTNTGAKYLALDEGLVELSIEDDAPTEAPVVPDVPEEAESPSEVGLEGESEPAGDMHMDIPKPEAVEVGPEVPATPKRRQSRKKATPAPKVEEAKVEEEPADYEAAVEEAMELAKPEKKPLTVDSVREGGRAKLAVAPTEREADITEEEADARRRHPVTSGGSKHQFPGDVYTEAHLDGYVDGMVDAERLADKAKDNPVISKVEPFGTEMVTNSSTENASLIIESTITENLRPQGYTTYNIGVSQLPRGVDSILRDLIGVMLEAADEDQLWQIAASVRGVVK
jgi:hypothetical protein